MEGGVALSDCDIVLIHERHKLELILERHLDLCCVGLVENMNNEHYWQDLSQNC